MVSTLKKKYWFCFQSLAGREGSLLSTMQYSEQPTAISRKDETQFCGTTDQKPNESPHFPSSLDTPRKHHLVIPMESFGHSIFWENNYGMTMRSTLEHNRNSTRIHFVQKKASQEFINQRNICDRQLCPKWGHRAFHLVLNQVKIQHEDS